MDDESSTRESAETVAPLVDTPPEIIYEETPVITPIPENVPPKKKSFLSLIKNIFLLGMLFIIGYVLSGVIRNVINTSQTTNINTKPAPVNQELTQQTPESTMTAITSEKPVVQPISWKQYNPINGTTRKPIDAIQFKLPSAVLPPICDGSACGSQGTYLPGGTRFTIAPRGAGQVLADFRGKIISDAGGKTFITKQTTVAGKQATEFSTANVGSTIGGYAFSTMHGYMIEVNDTLSLEINHFAPSGINVDFMADDALLKQIIATLTFGNIGSTEKGAPPTPIR
ncbi:MAG: hypothetical protein V1917_04730 [Candidatus Gottesmanbacteria bacterium]